MLSSLVSLAALLATVAAAPKKGHGHPSVTVSQGTIIGTTTHLPSATHHKVHKYLGIPFAANPPTRFLPPEPAPSFTGPLYAQTTKASCLQQFASAETEQLFQNVFTGGPIEESEDCLYLNVWAPAHAKKRKEKLPVMFWIYGGNLQFGTGSLPAYDGSSFAANQDVILVTHNYRTNVFGFSDSPEIPTDQQNAGLYDQRLALKWVHDNIEAFGGDPSRITIFGESAGGESVKQLLAFPPEPLNYIGAIMESEAVLYTGTGAASWETLLTELGCTSLACAQAANATQIKDIITSQSLMFGPSNDGKTFEMNVTPQFTSGSAAKVPFLIGNNQNEGRVFAYLLGLDNPTASLQSFLAAEFPGNTALITALEAIYTVNQTPYLAASEIITDAEFVCHASDFMTVGASQGYDMWRYNFNASFPNTQDFPDAGAYHSVEIPEVFGTYLGNDPYGDLTADQVALSKYMQTAWANFAKNPSGGPGWPQYGSQGIVANLGAPAAPAGISLINAASTIDARCPLYAALIAAEGP